MYKEVIFSNTQVCTRKTVPVYYCHYRVTKLFRLSSGLGNCFGFSLVTDLVLWLSEL